MSQTLRSLVVLVVGGGAVYFAAGLIVQSPAFAIPKDFLEYWASARLNLRGEDPYDPARLLAEQQRADPDRTKAVMMWNPPPALAVYMPLAPLRARLAALIWIALQLLAVMVACDFLWRAYAPNRPALDGADRGAFVRGDVVGGGLRSERGVASARVGRVSSCDKERAAGRGRRMGGVDGLEAAPPGWVRSAVDCGCCHPARSHQPADGNSRCCRGAEHCAGRESACRGTVRRGRGTQDRVRSRFLAGRCRCRATGCAWRSRRPVLGTIPSLCRRMRDLAGLAGACGKRLGLDASAASRCRGVGRNDALWRLDLRPPGAARSRRRGGKSRAFATCLRGLPCGPDRDHGHLVRHTGRLA